MAKCFVCGKSTKVGNRVSHANNKRKRTFSPNLQRIRVQTGRTVKRQYVCTSCLKCGKVVKAL